MDETYLVRVSMNMISVRTITSFASAHTHATTELEMFDKIALNMELGGVLQMKVL